MAARLVADMEASMPHPEAWVAALGDVIGRTAEPEDQESSKPLLGSLKIVACVHGAKHFIVRNATVERADETFKPFAADSRINFVFFHWTYF